jgi:hypothetical protein
MCIVNFFYATASGNDVLLGVSVIGVVLSSWYIFVYMKCTRRQTSQLVDFNGICSSSNESGRGRFRVFWLVEAALLLGLPLWSNLFDSSDLSTHFGVLVVGFSIYFFYSPLTAIFTVLKTGSTRSMPLDVTLANALNTLLWTVISFVNEDYYLGSVNAVGLLFSVVQLGLWWHYRATAQPMGIGLKRTVVVVAVMACVAVVVGTTMVG